MIFTLVHLRAHKLITKFCGTPKKYILFLPNLTHTHKNMYNFDSFVQDTYFTSAVVIFLFDGLREKQFMPLMKQVLRI